MIPVLKGFRSTPYKFCLCGITKAMLAGRHHFVSVGNRLKGATPEGTTPPGGGYITERSRDGLLLPAKPVL